MIEETTVYQLKCDGCGRVQYSPDGMVDGYYGTIGVHPNGADTKWFACRKRCGNKAPMAALERFTADRWGGDLPA